MGEDSKEDETRKDSADEDSKKDINEALKDDAVEDYETNEDDVFKNDADEDSKKDDNSKDGRIPVESAISFLEIGKAFNITLNFSTVSAVYLNIILWSRNRFILGLIL